MTFSFFLKIVYRNHKKRSNGNVDVESKFIKDYIENCVCVTWLMNCCIPSIFITQDVGEKFDKKFHTKFSGKGDFVEFYMWPCLFVSKEDFHNNQPAFGKGDVVVTRNRVESIDRSPKPGHPERQNETERPGHPERLGHPERQNERSENIFYSPLVENKSIFNLTSSENSNLKTTTTTSTATTSNSTNSTATVTVRSAINSDKLTRLHKHDDELPEKSRTTANSVRATSGVTTRQIELKSYSTRPVKIINVQPLVSHDTCNKDDGTSLEKNPRKIPKDEKKEEETPMETEHLEKKGIPAIYENMSKENQPFQLEKMEVDPGESQHSDPNCFDLKYDGDSRNRHFPSDYREKMDNNI